MSPCCDSFGRWPHVTWRPRGGVNMSAMKMPAHVCVKAFNKTYAHPHVSASPMCAQICTGVSPRYLETRLLYTDTNPRRDSGVRFCLFLVCLFFTLSFRAAFSLLLLPLLFVPYAHTQIHAHTHIHTHIHTHMFTHTHTHIHTCTHIHTIHTYTPSHVHTYAECPS